MFDNLKDAIAEAKEQANADGKIYFVYQKDGGEYSITDNRWKAEMELNGGILYKAVKPHEVIKYTTKKHGIETHVYARCKYPRNKDSFYDLLIGIITFLSPTNFRADNEGYGYIAEVDNITEGKKRIIEYWEANENREAVEA